MPRGQEVANAVGFQLLILEQKPILDRVGPKIKNFIDTFLEGMG